VNKSVNKGNMKMWWTTNNNGFIPGFALWLVNALPGLHWLLDYHR